MDPGIWIAERLMSLEKQEFETHAHRIFPHKILKNTRVRHFSVPLASGLGQAILVQPPLQQQQRDDVFVLFVHDVGADCTYPFWHWVRAYTQRGISVLAFDWDGHGAANHTHLDFQVATRSLPLLLQRLYGEKGGEGLRARREGPACYLVGHSMGATLSLLCASRPEIKEIVSGVVALSPIVSIHEEAKALQSFRPYLKPRAFFKDLLGKIPYYGFFGIFPTVRLAQKEKFPLRLNVGIDWFEQLKDFTYETFEGRKILKNIQTPVLWIHGVKDKIFSYEKTSQLMMDIQSALFQFADEKHEHLLMPFADEIINYSIDFIDANNRVAKK